MFYLIHFYEKTFHITHMDFIGAKNGEQHSISVYHWLILTYIYGYILSHWMCPFLLLYNKIKKQRQLQWPEAAEDFLIINHHFKCLVAWIFGTQITPADQWGCLYWFSSLFLCNRALSSHSALPSTHRHIFFGPGPLDEMFICKRTPT